MLKNLPLPLIYAVETLLWVPLLGAFYGTASFLAAKPIASLDLQGKALPASWEAAIPNHGKFLQGYLVASHPVAFSALVVVLVGSAFLLYQVHKAQVAQRQAAVASGTKSHAIAHGCVFAILALLAYLFITHFLVSVSAA